MKKITIIFICMFFINNIHCQSNWQVIDIPDEWNIYDIRTMYHDSVENALWMGGLIRHVDSA